MMKTSCAGKFEKYYLFKQPPITISIDRYSMELWTQPSTNQTEKDLFSRPFSCVSEVTFYQHILKRQLSAEKNHKHDIHDIRFLRILEGRIVLLLQKETNTIRPQ